MVFFMTTCVKVNQLTHVVMSLNSKTQPWASATFTGRSQELIEGRSKTWNLNRTNVQPKLQECKGREAQIQRIAIALLPKLDPIQDYFVIVALDFKCWCFHFCIDQVKFSLSFSKLYPKYERQVDIIRRESGWNQGLSCTSVQPRLQQ